MGGLDLAQLGCLLLQPLPVSKVTAVNLTAYLVLDTPVAILTIAGNGIFLLTLLKTRSLHTPSNVLLGVMCISDLAVGLGAQPSVLTRNIFMLSGIDYRKAQCIYSVLGVTASGLSLLFAVLVSLDRYVAICHPFLYERVVTFRRQAYAAAILSTVMVVLSLVIVINRTLYKTGSLASGFFASIVICISYLRIWKVIGKQRKKVFSAQMVDGAEARKLRNIKKEINKSYTVFMILAAFLLCYTPYFAFVFYYIVNYWNTCTASETEFLISLWVEFIVIINSCINPMIYCFRSKEMRTAALKIVRPKSLIN